MGFLSWFRQAPQTSPYRQVVGRPFSAGGMEWALTKQHAADPLFFNTGTGYRYGLLNVFQHPQVYAPLRAPLSGLGGVQAGQLVLQPLVDSDYSPME